MHDCNSRQEAVARLTAATACYLVVVKSVVVACQHHHRSEPRGGSAAAKIDFLYNRFYVHIIDFT